jgi:hypothetical protein
MVSLHGSELLGDLNVRKRRATKAFEGYACFVIFTASDQPSGTLGAELDEDKQDRRHCHEDDEWDLVAETGGIGACEASNDAGECHRNDDDYNQLFYGTGIILIAYRPKPTPRRLAGSDSTMYI